MASASIHFGGITRFSAGGKDDLSDETDLANVVEPLP